MQQGSVRSQMSLLAVPWTAILRQERKIVQNILESEEAKVRKTGPRPQLPPATATSSNETRCLYIYKL